MFYGALSFLFKGLRLKFFFHVRCLQWRAAHHPVFSSITLFQTFGRVWRIGQSESKHIWIDVKGLIENAPPFKNTKTRTDNRAGFERSLSKLFVYNGYKQFHGRSYPTLTLPFWGQGSMRSAEYIFLRRTSPRSRCKINSRENQK